MALHEQSVGTSDEWYTPPRVFEALDCVFDMDVASPGQSVTPWIPARSFLTRDSLTMPWTGFVWMNPPFGPRNGLMPWLTRFFSHGDGVALVPDRTSAPWWQQFATRAELALFVNGKLKFIDANGVAGGSPAQGTSLLASGRKGCAALERAAANGLGLLMRPVPINWSDDMTSYAVCPACGQPRPPEGIALPKIKQRILDAVKRCPGISAEELRDVVWADDPSGGPEDRKVLHVHVNQLNHLLAPHGIAVRSQGGGYQIRSTGR